MTELKLQYLLISKVLNHINNLKCIDKKEIKDIIEEAIISIPMSEQTKKFIIKTVMGKCKKYCTR